MAHSVETLTGIACVTALVGLVIMVASLVYPAPLLVIFAMSGGHVVGAFAVLCYLLAVVMDAKRSRRSLAPPPPRADSAQG
jgi:hypothetical protein